MVEDDWLGGWMASSRVSSSLNRLLEASEAVRGRSVENMSFGPLQRRFSLRFRSQLRVVQARGTNIPAVLVLVKVHVLSVFWPQFLHAYSD